MDASNATLAHKVLGEGASELQSDEAGTAEHGEHAEGDAGEAQ
jgi:hypothetical protein